VLHNLIIVLKIITIVSYIIIALILINLQFVLHIFPNIITIVKSKKVKWRGHVAYMRQMGSIYKILIEKSEGKRPLRRPGHRWDTKKKLRGFGPLANSADRATAACWRSSASFCG
jgi:hypothetical protein